MPGSNEYSLSPELKSGEATSTSLVSRAEVAKSPFYQKQAFTRRTFDRDAKLAEMYGTLASRRDRRRFEKYWNSEQRLADEKAFNEAEDQRLLAHEDAESKKYMASVDLWIAGMNDRAKAAGAATLTPVLTPVQTPIETPVLPQVPVVLTPKPTTDGKFGKQSLQNPQNENKTISRDVAEEMPIVGSYIAGRDFFTRPTKQLVLTFGKKVLGDIASYASPEIRRTRIAKGLWDGAKRLWDLLPDFKDGGNIYRYQLGGTAPQQAAQAQDIQQQVVALVQAAMLGDQKATQTVNKIMEAAKAGDKQAMQIAQMIQQVAQKMQGQTPSDKFGAKINYIRSLKYAHGGKTCPACQAAEKGDKIEKKACGGKKAKKHYFGGWL